MTAPSVQLDWIEEGTRLLRENGYLLVRNVVPADQVERIRTICERYLLPDDDAENEINATALLQMPDMNFIFDEQVVKALTAWLGGTLCYYPNYVARLNRRSGWHIDNGFSPEYLPDGSHLFDPEFRHVQCIVYLQDNRAGAGGGLDVRARSHKWATTGDLPEEDFIALSYPEVVLIDSQAGDLVLFDGRVMHRGTPQDGSHELRKYGIFWSASRKDRLQMDRYIEFFTTRVDHLRTLNLSPHDLERESNRFNDMYNVRFPESYLSETTEIIRKNAIALAEMPRRTGA